MFKIFKKNVSDQIVEILSHNNVKRVYGIPGDTIDSLMESLRKQNDIDFIILRHEETGAFAATGHGKLTGKLGVCLACQGPGANHLINGLYDATTDRVPVLAITGAVPNGVIGTQMPQETNQIKLFDDCTVYNAEVRNAENLPIVLERAINAALTKRGAAHVSIPSDIMREAAVKWEISNRANFVATENLPTKDELTSAADVLNKATKVAILYGEGSRHASDALIEISHKLQSPLIHTTRSKDIIANDESHLIGGIGLMGSVASNYALHHCDALLIVGSNYAWRAFYPKEVPVVQIDVESTHIGARTVVSNPLLGKSKATLEALSPYLTEKKESKFLEKCKTKTTSIQSRIAFNPKASNDGKPIHPQAVMSKINELASDDAIFCCDAGSVTIWANNILQIKPDQRFIWCANLASLGNALPYSIACKQDQPKRQVIALCGDGGFQMSIMDLPTVVMHQLPIVFIVYNNSSYRFIELEEQGEGNPVFGTKFCNPDYAKLAEAHGAMGITIKNHSEIEGSLQKAFSANQPCVVDVLINPDELIIPPIISAEQTLHFAESQIKSWFSNKC